MSMQCSAALYKIWVESGINTPQRSRDLLHQHFKQNMKFKALPNKLKQNWLQDSKKKDICHLTITHKPYKLLKLTISELNKLLCHCQQLAAGLINLANSLSVTLIIRMNAKAIKPAMTNDTPQPYLKEIIFTSRLFIFAHQSRSMSFVMMIFTIQLFHWCKWHINKSAIWVHNHYNKFTSWVTKASFTLICRWYVQSTNCFF